MAKNPYKITARKINDGILGTVYYNDEIIKEQEYILKFSSSINGETFSGEEGVIQDLTFTSKTFGFFENGKTYLAFVPEEEKTFGPKLEDFEKKQKELFLESGRLGLPIPGLNKDDVLENLAKKDPGIKTIIDTVQENYSELVERGDITEDEATNLASKEIEDTVKSYTANMESLVEEKIAEANQNFTVFKESVESIPSDVQAAITNIALPPTISVPPSAPNPVWIFNLIKQTKNSLVRTLSVAIAAFAIVLKTANQIKFELPNSILELFDKIKICFTVINTIPV